MYNSVKSGLSVCSLIRKKSTIDITFGKVKGISPWWWAFHNVLKAANTSSRLAKPIKRNCFFSYPDKEVPSCPTDILKCHSGLITDYCTSPKKGYLRNDTRTKGNYCKDCETYSPWYFRRMILHEKRCCGWIGISFLAYWIQQY